MCPVMCDGMYIIMWILARVSTGTARRVAWGENSPVDCFQVRTPEHACEGRTAGGGLGVIPAQAGNQGWCRRRWIPACAGMTGGGEAQGLVGHPREGQFSSCSIAHAGRCNANSQYWATTISASVKSIKKLTHPRSRGTVLLVNVPSSIGPVLLEYFSERPKVSVIH